MTHEEALANILHLEERGKRGEGLTHAGGHQWTPEHLKEFGHHARTKLHAHLVERKQQQEKQVQEAREKLHRDMSRPLRRYEPVGSHYPGTKPFAVMETETGRHVTSEGYERRFATHEAADTWAQREHDKYWRQQEREGQQRLKQAKEQQRISIDVGTQSKAQRQDVAVESVQGGLAIQRALSTERSADGTYPQNQSDWHVVHIPTGKKLPVTTSRGGETLKKYQALAVQHALLALPIAWEKFVDPRTVTAEQKEHIRQVLSQMPPQRSPAAARKRDARIAATKE
jgi:hypothetical protein